MTTDPADAVLIKHFRTRSTQPVAPQSLTYSIAEFLHCSFYSQSQDQLQPFPLSAAKQLTTNRATHKIKVKNNVNYYCQFARLYESFETTNITHPKL